MPDYLRPAITRELAPVLKQAGFTRSKPAHFLRADGDILHSIAFILTGLVILNVFSRMTGH